MNKKTLIRVLKYIKNYRLTLLISIILSVITVAGTLYLPILAGSAIDLITGTGGVNFALITPLLTKAAAVTLLTALLQWIMHIINNNVACSVVRDIRASAFRKIEELPLKYLDAHSSGDIVSRVIADADQFSDGLLLGFTQLFTGVVTIIGTLIFMLSINIRITFAVVILTPISVFAAKFIASRTYSMFRKQAETRGEQTAFIDEALTNQKLVRAFCYGERAKGRFYEINERLKQHSMRAVFFSSLTNPTTRFVNSLVYAAVALLGALSAIRGAITIGGLSCFLSYANQYTKPFNEISGVVAELQNALACAARLFEFIDEPSEEESANAVLQDVRGEITLDNVCFSYSADKKLIEDFNLRAKPGQKIAIVGPTGCGKTTIINLLMRFYDINSGKISVDGTDVGTVTRASLRKSYGMVLQETWLMNGTIKENIAIGKPNADMDEIIAAAKASHAHSFIKRMPLGYDTPVSETDSGLSQGEKQLLCIARIMLCMPPMLILDEATSSIDTRTEMKIQDAFSKLMKGRTSFIVAHRLSTVRDADIILVMRGGKIVEQGNHAELIEKNGFYAELYNSQFAG